MTSSTSSAACRSRWSTTTLVEKIDTSRLPNWANDSYVDEFLGKGKPGFQFIGYDNDIYGVPTVLQGDSFAYLPEKTGKLDSYAALFDPKWKGYVALEDNYTTAGQKTALYLKKNGLANIANPDDMTKEEFKTVTDFLIDQKKKGQFRVIWNSFEQAVNLITSKEVYVIDCWEPMVFVAKSKGMDVVYADPKEGYLLWAMAAYLVKNPNRRCRADGSRLQAPRFHAGRLVRRQDHQSARLHDQSASRELCQGHAGRVPGRGGQAGRRDHRERPAQIPSGRHLAEPLADRGRVLRIGVVALQGGVIPRSVAGVRGVRMAVRPWARRVLLCLPMIFVAVFLVIPLGLTVMISFWERAGVKFRPALSLASYVSLVGGARLDVLQRSLVVAIEATALSLVIAYVIAYFLARKVAPATARIVLVLFTVPFLINYIVRDVSYTVLLGRTGVVNSALLAAGIIDAPLDWLLYSDFAVLLGLISAYMPFMIFPLFLSIGAIDRQYLEASALLGASPFTIFRTITLPLSLPGVFAAGLFGLVGCLGESAVPIILGGVGYELIGNTITSSMDVLNYPLAAALSSVVIVLMLLMILGWYLVFDMRSFLGRILEWRA